jgi:hypothetical protein
MARILVDRDILVTVDAMAGEDGVVMPCNNGAANGRSAESEGGDR